ncbi:MAG: copper homeostasis protein CutC [Bacteroidaceae bacterium]|nr:copper homeostasis protein CutC [Bacteroidaceae bacterium]
MKPEREMKLEVCCADWASVMAAKAGGAHRIELCEALELDGLTPGSELIGKAVESGIRVHVLIRPREGDFVYSEAEVRLMIQQIAEARQLGAQGVVWGALTGEGRIDVPLCRRLMEASRGMSVTFHRAFDVCREPLAALEDIISLGCHRLLTSGQAPSALQGIPLLRQLVAQAAGRIIIMPGAGVSPQNAAQILSETGATEIHGSLRMEGHTSEAMVREVVGAL